MCAPVYVARVLLSNQLEQSYRFNIHKNDTEPLPSIQSESIDLKYFPLVFFQKLKKQKQRQTKNEKQF